jgi:hypothetical protein
LEEGALGGIAVFLILGIIVMTKIFRGFVVDV